MDREVHRLLVAAATPRHSFAEHYLSLLRLLAEARDPQYNSNLEADGIHFLLVSKPYVCGLSTEQFQRLALDAALDERASRHGNYLVMPFDSEIEARMVQAFLVQVFGLSARISPYLRN